MPNEPSGKWIAVEKDGVWDVLCDKHGDGTLYSVLEYTTEEQAKLIAQAPALRAELQQARAEIESSKRAAHTRNLQILEMDGSNKTLQQQLAQSQLALYKMTEQRNQFKSALESNDQ